MKIKNIQSIAFIKNLTKAYTEGIYADTPANRKLGRVGMSYAAYAEKVKGKEKKENSSKDKKEEIDKKFFNDIKDLPFTEKKPFPFGRRYGERKIGSANGHNYHIDTPATKKGKYFVDGKVCKDKEEFLKKINKLPKEGKFKDVNELPFGEKTRTRSGGWLRECTIDGHLFVEYDKEIGRMHGKYEIDDEPVSKIEFLSLANEYSSNKEDIKKDEKSWDKIEAFYKKGSDEDKLWDFWYKFQKSGDPSHMSSMRQIFEKKFPKVNSWKQTTPNTGKATITALSKNGDIIAELDLSGDKVNLTALQTFMDKCHVGKSETEVLVDKTETLKNAEGKRLDAIIKYSNSAEEEGIKGIKVADDATDEEKKIAIAKFYKEAAEDDADNLDEIIEEALADYVPEEKD